jgi:tetratricopeptide (TPR) repeat protein
MLLYRSVSLQELELIYDSGMKVFPARLPQQPIFYPVLELEYARQIASEWNAESGQSAGYVTQFKVDDPYISQFEKHAIGESQRQEFWIPAEELEEFNRHIIGDIKVVEAHFGDEFQGFVPEKFGLQGKNAVAQFTLLTNSYIYTRMDFYLEIRRNHKAVFLNYPFWQKYDFKNPGLKEKILQAIRDAWLKSSPKIPLPMPVHEDTTLVEQTASHVLVDPDPEDVTPLEQTDSHPLADPDHEDSTLIEQTGSHLSQGLEFGLSGKYQEAIDELSGAVEEDPRHPVAHTSLGVALHRLGEDDRALSCYETALRVDPTYAEAHYFRANILYSQGNVREAIAGYTLAVGLKPELIEAHQKSIPQDQLTDYNGSPAEMYWIAKPARRILDLNRMLETHPRQTYLFKERAAEYYRLRNYVQAIADYSSYLAIQPDDASVLHFRGVAYEQIGQFDRALEDYQRAIAIDPQLSDAYINRGVTFGKMGNFRQSIASLTEGIRLAPRNPDGYFNRGTAYLQQGDFEKAIDDFSNVIRLSPGDEEAYYWRGISNEEAGQPRAAIADYRQFLAISQNSEARDEIEQKLSQWNEGKRNSVSSQSVVPDDRQRTNQPPLAGPDLDLHGLIVALGERALNSTWFGSGVDCYGEKAEELYAFTDQNKPIEGHDLLHITSGIRQTIEGDFQAFDPGATSHWIFIRAWDGSGFYIETNDHKIRGQLKTCFQTVEEVEGVSPPYEGLFITSDQTSK